MKKFIKRSMLALVFLGGPIFTQGQCEILNRVYSDGTMQYYMEPVNFYQTSTKSLKGCIVTDRENYYLKLYPFPFPKKPDGNKLREVLELKLANGNSYQLKHWDTRYVQNDSVMTMLFFIDKATLDPILNFEVVDVKIDMKGAEGIRPYVFKLHKSALKEQLACFLKEAEERKKK